MKRIYQTVINDHLVKHRQMAFIAGPRQVGKTTISQMVNSHEYDLNYLNWDNTDNNQIIIKGPKAIAERCQLERATQKNKIIIFDEIHKYSRWKQFLKGFYDTYSLTTKIIVTGSAKLNIYRKVGDSLMGRYFLYRMHPLSVSELINTTIIKDPIRQPQKISQEKFLQLYTYGGFPEPYIKKNQHFLNQWSSLRHDQLVNEDVRDTSQIQELAQFNMLTSIIESMPGRQLNYSNLATMINVSVPTVKRWINILENLYYCFTIKPWSKNIKRSIKKEPKVYLWDWSKIKDAGAKIENFVASHLLKATHYWKDMGYGDYKLHFVRDKEKREVDFLISLDDEPWLLVEVKASANSSISKSLYYYYDLIKPTYAFQVAFDLPYEDVDCFAYGNPVIVPAISFLSQLI